MRTTFEEWLDGVEEPQPPHRVSVFREALLLGYRDRKAVAQALAVAEATAKLAEEHPIVPFDEIAELVLDYYDSQAAPLVRRWRVWLWRAYLRDEVAWAKHRLCRWLKRVWMPPGRARIEVDDGD